MDLALGRQLALVPELETLARRASVSRALPRAADAGALPVGTPGRRARRVPADPHAPERRAGPRARQRAAGAATRDPRPGPRADAGSSSKTGGDRRLSGTSARSRAWRPSSAADAEFFFGRERLVEELLGRLEDVPLLALVGASGSGKSSLLRAGLLPALDRDHVLVRPGEPQPFAGTRRTSLRSTSSRSFSRAEVTEEQRACVRDRARRERHGIRNVARS